MASQRPPGRGSFPPRGPRPTSGHAGARRPKPATSGPSDRNGPQARREAKPFRAKVAAPKGPRAGQSAPGEDRLQKILAHAGVGSRRACEELILQGRVTVGGQVVKELGTKVDLAKIHVAVDGQKIQQERLVYFAVNKPKGFVSTNNDPSGRPLVLDLLPGIAQRVYTIGRLDEMSVGLMLVTNDGELANKLAHPKFGVEKLYRVIVAGTPERETLNQLTEGIWLAEGKVRAKRVRAVAKKGDATILELVLAEGKNREVRRMLAKLGHKVMMLTRVAVGPITLKGLAAGQVRPLTGKEVDLLRRVAAGEPVPMPWATDHRPTRDNDRPRRTFGSAPGGPGDRRAVRDDRPARDQPGRFGSAPPRASAPPIGPRGAGDRPHGPGYRDHQPTEDRRPGPPGAFGGPPRDHDRRPGGPPRRPGMFQAPRDDSTDRFSNDRRPGPPGGPRDRRADGPRMDGPPPYQRQDGPRPGDRPGGPRPSQRQDGPRPDHGPGGPRPFQRQDGPRPGSFRPHGPQDGPGRDDRADGPRPYRQHDGPRGGDRPGGPRPHGQYDGPRGSDRPGEPRPFQRQDGPQGRPPASNERDSRPPRPGQRPGQGGPGMRPGGGPPRHSSGNDRRPGAPTGGAPADRRPRTPNRPPGPNSFEPTRKVIGLDASQATTPSPSPGSTEEQGAGRPKPRLNRPAPRGAGPGSPRPMPKRRISRRDDD